MYSIRNRKWSNEILEALRVPASMLPSVADIGKKIGTLQNEYADALGLPAGIVIRAGLGDTQASYIGSGCTPSEFLLNFGTGSQLMWEEPTFRLVPETDTRYLSESRYLIAIPTLSGGESYRALAEFFRDVIRAFTDQDALVVRLYERMNELALNSHPSTILIEPFFNGHRFRGEELRASISGLDLSNFTVQNLTDAMLRGMIEELAQPYGRAGVKHKGIVASGNGIRRNAALRKRAVERFGLKLRLSNHEEEAALGAAMVAAG